MAHFPVEMALERDSDIPLGTQLSWKLRAAIASGTLRPGDRLPPVRDMAARAGVNVNTVRAVFARLAKQGVIVSEHGRGTFVSATPSSGAELGHLVERTAREARRNAVDPRELAAMLYARFDEPTAVGADEADPGERRALRAEIEALEHDLAELEPQFAGQRGESRGSGPGARLVSARELEAIRDELAARVADCRRQLREARARARAEEPQPAAPRREREPSPWPELLPVAPGRLAT